MEQRTPLMMPKGLLEDNPKQTKSASDPNFVRITLPSNCVFYDFDEVSARSFGLNHQKKFHRGVMNSDIRTMVEAVGHCLDKDIFTFTIGDFWMFMYWLKIQSFKKSPYEIEFKCHDEGHVAKVGAKELNEITLTNKVSLTQSDLKEITLFDTHDKQEALKRLDELKSSLEICQRLDLSVATIGDLVESEEILESIGSKNSDELSEDDEYLFKYASILSHKHGVSLKDRIRFLIDADLSSDDVIELDKYIDAVDHGVKEVANVQCKECGMSREVPISLDMYTFLPSIFG